MSQSKFYVGQPIEMIYGKDVRWKGIVTDVMQSLSNSYPIIVEVKTGAGLGSYSFTGDGKFDRGDERPSLFPDVQEARHVSL